MINEWLNEILGSVCDDRSPYKIGLEQALGI